MKRLGVLALFLMACKTTSMDLKNLTNDTSALCRIGNIEAPEGVCETPDGLSVVGDFDPERDTVIFTHGWIPSYEMGVPGFVNAEGWQAKGFNTLLFRFMRKASDLGDGETCKLLSGSLPLFDLIELSCPKYAEQRVWMVDGIGEDLLRDFKLFFSNKLDYTGEIRIVGHSLGGQIASFVGSALIDDKTWQGPHPHRVDILDPWVGYGLLNTGELKGSLSKLYPRFQNKPHSNCTESNSRSSYCAMENALWNLQLKGVAVTIFGSNAAGAFAYDLRHNFPYMAFNENWLCQKALLGNDASCLSRGLSMFTAQHFFPLLAYFWSINEAAPKGGLSAATATGQIPRKAWYRKQRAQSNWCHLPPGVVFWKKGGLDHVFGMTRYPGQANRGIQIIPSGKEEFANRMHDTLSFTSVQAKQCADAISLSNDEFL